MIFFKKLNDEINKFNKIKRKFNDKKDGFDLISRIKIIIKFMSLNNNEKENFINIMKVINAAVLEDYVFNPKK